MTLDPGLARTTDPSTSHEAAKSVDATAMEGLVLRTLQKHGPRTSEQIAELTGESLVTISPRLNPLLKKGLVVKSGRGVNKSGRSAILWRAL